MKRALARFYPILASVMSALPCRSLYCTLRRQGPYLYVPTCMRTALILIKEMSGRAVYHGSSLNRSAPLRVHLDPSGWDRDEQGVAQASGRVAHSY